MSTTQEFIYKDVLIEWQISKRIIQKSYSSMMDSMTLLQYLDDYAARYSFVTALQIQPPSPATTKNEGFVSLLPALDNQE